MWKYFAELFYVGETNVRILEYLPPKEYHEKWDNIN